MATQKVYLASLDQSTTSTKFSIYLYNGTLVDQQLIPHQQISLQEGWLEHNPDEIIENVEKAISVVIKRLQQKQGFSVSQILGVGLCNQRQTIVCWDPETGKPFHNAIVWVDARTKDVCERFKSKYSNFTQRTGLPVSTYFSLFKILWLLQTIPFLVQKAKQGKVRFGTMDSWVAYKLTGRFVTDPSNASRTHLIDIKTGKWDKQLLDIAGISEQCLPVIVSSFENVGDIKYKDLQGVSLSCILGDQQSSAYAHGLKQNQMKITYGTGCFMLIPIGSTPIIDSAFVTTILNQKKEEKQFGFEVSVECGGGTINWAKTANLLSDYDQLNNLKQFDQEGLFFMPSFGTMFSPFFQSDVSGGIVGLSYNTKKQHVLKAILNSITYRLYDNIKNEKLNKITKIIVDGGMTINKQFMQSQANLFNKEIEVRSLDTCWGVAQGVLTSKGLDVKLTHFEHISYKPTGKHSQQVSKYERWSLKRQQFYGWK